VEINQPRHLNGRDEKGHATRELEMAKKEPTSFRERAPTSDFGNVSIAVF
jgi:hypothetical protein